MVTRWIWRCVIVAGLVACGPPDTGAVHGDWLVVQRCKGGLDHRFEPYDMGADFFALQDVDDVAFVRIQPGGKPLHRTDALVIQINNVGFVRQRLGFEIAIDSTQVRATLHVLGSCPETAQSMTAHNGFVRFDRFSVTPGERVVGRFMFELQDERTGEVVGGGFRGDFDFKVRAGRPYEPFSNQ